MRIPVVTVVMTVLIAASVYSAPLPYTVTFDDVPTGQDIRNYYYQQYGLWMSQGWQAVGGVASGWGSPQSDPNIAVWYGPSSFTPAFYLGFDGVDEYTALSVGAFFSTEAGNVLQMVGYGKNFNVVATTSIGSAIEAWAGRYAEISSTSGDIYTICIVGISSSDARYHFAMDDLTIVPVPEPSSLLALLGGLAGVGGLALRRRRI